MSLEKRIAAYRWLLLLSLLVMALGIVGCITIQSPAPAAVTAAPEPAGNQAAEENTSTRLSDPTVPPLDLPSTWLYDGARAPISDNSGTLYAFTYHFHEPVSGGVFTTSMIQGIIDALVAVVGEDSFARCTSENSAETVSMFWHCDNGEINISVLLTNDVSGGVPELVVQRLVP